MKPKGIIFDFDGVIVDSLALHAQAWEEASQEVLGKALSPAEKEEILRRSTDSVALMLTKNQSTVATKLADSKRSHLIRQNFVAALFPGVNKVFDFLSDKNIPFGIASNAPKDYVLTALSRLNLKANTTIGYEDYKKPKPAPDPFLACAEKLKILKSDFDKVLVFEDSLHGIQAAVNAKMIPIGVSTRHQPKELRDAGAKLVCAHLRDAFDKGWFEEFPDS